MRTFTLAPDDMCNLPDGCQILHVEQLYDDKGEYLQVWASVPQSSELARETRIIEEVEEHVESPPASDAHDRLNGDYETDEADDDDGAMFKT